MKVSDNERGRESQNVLTRFLLPVRPKKKKKQGRKKSLEYSMKTFFYRFGFAFLLNF